MVKEEGNTYRTYPADMEGKLFDWDFYDRSNYEIRVVNKNNPIAIFNAINDSDYLARQWTRGIQVMPGEEPGTSEYRVNIEKLFTPDNENLNREEIHDYSFRFYFGEKVKGRQDQLKTMQKIVIRGHALNDKPCTIQLALVMKDGSAFGGTIKVETEKGDYELMISSLKPVKTVTLPRPYPTFLPYYFEHESSTFDMNQVENLQFSLGPGIPEIELQTPQGISIESVWLK